MGLSFVPSKNDDDKRKKGTQLIIEDLSPDLTDHVFKNVKFNTQKDEGTLLILLFCYEFFYVLVQILKGRFLLIL